MAVKPSLYLYNEALLLVADAPVWARILEKRS